jgi:dolichol-phosphate mannosyltransferase
VTNPVRSAADARPDILPCTRPVPGSTDRSGRGLLSVVIPCHNEEAVIDATHARLVAVLPATAMDFEIIYIDDGSRDATLPRLAAIAARDPRVRVIELARNFGQQAAMSAGIAAARGDAVVITDADLQDPPEVIPEMVRAWRSGVDVAYGRRRSREGETWFKRTTARHFYRLFASLMPYPVPVDTGDFKLIDRAVADAVARLPEKRRYLRSLVPWAGFRHEPVLYDRHARAAGTTKYSPWKLLKLAGDAVVLSSDVPMRLTWVATGGLAAVAVMSGLAALTPLWRSETQQAGVSLAAVTAVVTLVAAVQTAAVAIVGEYVVRTYREAQGRPPYVVRRTLSSNAAARARTDDPSSQAA